MSYIYLNEMKRKIIFCIFWTFLSFQENTIQLVTTEGYSKFLVKKFMEYGTKAQKAKIIGAFAGKTRNLMKQKVAADVLEEVWFFNTLSDTISTDKILGRQNILADKFLSGKFFWQRAWFSALWSARILSDKVMEHDDAHYILIDVHPFVLIQ